MKIKTKNGLKRHRTLEFILNRLQNDDKRLKMTLLLRNLH